MTPEPESISLNVDGIAPRTFIKMHIQKLGCVLETVFVTSISGGGLLHIGIDPSEDSVGDKYVYKFKCIKHNVFSSKFESPIPPTE